RAHDRPVQPAGAHDLLHLDEVVEDVLQEPPCDGLDDVAHARSFALVEGPGAADHDEASGTGPVHGGHDASRTVGAHRGGPPGVAAADGGDDGVAAGHGLLDRRRIHDVSDDDVEPG